MKVRTVTLAAILSATISAPALADDGCEGDRTATSAKISAQVTGLRQVKGEVTITVYPDDKRRFLAKGGKLARVRTKALAVTRACFWVTPGNYAIAIYHDVNADRKFNRTMVGLPAEGFGFSNNPETKVGLPLLSAARFATGPGEKVVAIQTRYLR